MTSVNFGYRGQDLWIPKSFQDEFLEVLVGMADPRRPFSRQIDLWWFAFCVGVELGVRTPLPSRDNRVRFNEAGILESDPWRITHLELFALSELGVGDASGRESGESSDVAPGQVMQMANEYANTGFLDIRDGIRGLGDPQLYFVNGLRQNGA